MLHARLLHVAFVGFSVCSFLSGCRSEHGSANKDPFMAKLDRIKNDGSQNLAAVETIMGAKGTEVPKETWSGLDPNAPPFTKSKLVKENDNTFKAVADKDGTEAKVYSWSHESKGSSIGGLGTTYTYTYIYVAVLEDKVVSSQCVISTNSGPRPKEDPK